MQDVFLGLNAWINFDLGIAAAESVSRARISSMEGDFERLQEIFCSLTGEIRREVSSLSPWMSLLDRLSKRRPNRLAQFNLTAACRSAWKVARDLAALNSQQKHELIRVLDRRVAKQAHLLDGRGVLQRPVMWLVRRRESRDIRSNIQALVSHPAGA